MTHKPEFYAQAERLGISYHTLMMRRHRHRHRPNESNPRPGEVTLKQWLIAESIRLGTSRHALECKLWRNGKYPKLRRVNKRLIYVNQNPS